jgi:hypothetical protein
MRTPMGGAWPPVRRLLLKSIVLGSPHPPLSEAARPPFGGGFGSSGRLSMVSRPRAPDVAHPPFGVGAPSDSMNTVINSYGVLP